MFLRSNRRFKDGKEHRYWSLVENKRCAGGKVVQRAVLYLGEINDSQREAWCRVVDAFDEEAQQQTQLALFPADRSVPDHARGHGVQVRLGAMALHAPRQWGACWLACHLYEQLGLDRFWADRLEASREGTSWRHIVQTLVCYRLIDPGSEWRLHRQWFAQSAMGDLLGADRAAGGRQGGRDQRARFGHDLVVRSHSRGGDHVVALRPGYNRRWRKKIDQLAANA